MDGVAIALQAPEEAECEDADHEADEWHQNADTSDDSMEQLMMISNVALEKKHKLDVKLQSMFVWREKQRHFSSNTKQRDGSNLMLCTII